ncbi:hypothetical protein BDN67DRAFT_928701, partial [Paxillus ammoniavirescens]
ALDNRAQHRRRQKASGELQSPLIFCTCHVLGLFTSGVVHGHYSVSDRRVPGPETWGGLLRPDDVRATSCGHHDSTSYKSFYYIRSFSESLLAASSTTGTSPASQSSLPVGLDTGIFTCATTTAASCGCPSLYDFSQISSATLNSDVLVTKW